MLKLPWPTCAKCQKPVDHLETARNAARCSILVTAKCHGETEQAELLDMTLADASSIEAVAFAQPALKESARG